MQRPNIVCITTDQQSCDTLSAYNNPYIRTHGMDRLAENGTTFSNTYCAFPLCTPSRASLFTGLYPSMLSVMDNGGSLTKEHKDRSLGVRLRRAEYECAYAGKWHVPTIEMPAQNDLGFEVIGGFDDTRISKVCTNFLERTHDRPFFLSVNIDNPHNICEWARSQPLPWGDIEQAPLRDCPPILPNTHATGYLPEAIRAGRDRYPQFYGLRDYDTDDDWRRYRHAYYRLIEKADRIVEKILCDLDRFGYLQNTVVVFTSDHGDGQSAHGLRQKTFLFEEQTRVPMIVTDFRNPMKRRCADLICNGTDLYPTLLSYARIPHRVEAFARDMSNMCNVDQDRSVLVQTNIGYDTQNRTSGRMIRTRNMKYVRYNWGRYREQLFDLASDPMETVNLAYCSYYDEQLLQARKKLRTFMDSIKDEFTG